MILLPGNKRYQRKRPAQTTTIPPPSAVIDLERPSAPKKPNITTTVTSTTTVSYHEPDQTQTENMVPLESYYYGTMEGDPNNPLAARVTLNVRCCVCKIPFSNNIQLLDHMLAHAHNISTKAAITQCRYCLASLPTIEDLNKHIGDAHPTETKSYSNSNLACLICANRYTSVYMLGKHMSKEHVPLEMPYQCGTCNFRTSCHRTVVDHFYKEHNGATTVQCPFCLKSTTVWSSGRVMSTNVTFFLAHLQKHQKKAMAKKCGKCALWFIHKDTLKEHQTKMHSTMTDGELSKKVVPYPLPTNYVMVPKSKIHMAALAAAVLKPPSRQATPEPVIHNLTLMVTSGASCKECKKPMNSHNHFP